MKPLPAPLTSVIASTVHLTVTEIFHTARLSFLHAHEVGSWNWYSSGDIAHHTLDWDHFDHWSVESGPQRLNKGPEMFGVEQVFLRALLCTMPGNRRYHLPLFWAVYRHQRWLHLWAYHSRHMHQRRLGGEVCILHEQPAYRVAVLEAALQEPLSSNGDHQ